jgi:hypothetical protein
VVPFVMYRSAPTPGSKPLIAGVASMPEYATNSGSSADGVCTCHPKG